MHNFMFWILQVSASKTYFFWGLNQVKWNKFKKFYELTASVVHSY